MHVLMYSLSHIESRSCQYMRKVELNSFRYAHCFCDQYLDKRSNEFLQISTFQPQYNQINWLTKQ